MPTFKHKKSQKPLGIIGREPEINLLQKTLDSTSPEFLAVYGRRRVGKTYLISTFFSEQSCVLFQSVGIRNGKLSDQLKQFTQELGRVFYHGAELIPKTNWMDAFLQLQQACETYQTQDQNKNQNQNQKIVLFLDELPWMATPKSGLLEALEFFWNRHGAKNSNIILIICGSAASWILNNIINNQEGLYNRVTRPIKLLPLTLDETKTYLEARGFSYPETQILALSLALVGIPFYLNLLDPKLSVPQNLDQICFNQTAPLLEEFKKLFASLFKNSEQHLYLINLIGKHTYGLELKKLSEDKKLSTGGRLSLRLQELEDAGFIMKFSPYGYQNKGTFYRVIDPFSLFYLRFIQPFNSKLKKLDQSHGYFLLISQTQGFKSWKGYAFEAVCLQHLYAIRKALKIEADASIHTWRYQAVKSIKNTEEPKEAGAQIDLIFDRSDGVVQLCEIKCTHQPFLINKTYRANLKNKLEVFQKLNSQKICFLSFITASGLTDNIYSQELVNSVVSLKDFFNKN